MFNRTLISQFFIRLLPLVLFIMAGTGVTAQVYICQDSSQIQNAFTCFADFKPVCGCNGITYRNACIAQYHNGVFNFVEGICQPIHVDVNPNPVQNVATIDIAIKPGKKQTLYMSIYDMRGNVKLVQMYRDVELTHKHQLDLTGFPLGVYIILIHDLDNFVVKRFVKRP